MRARLASNFVGFRQFAASRKARYFVFWAVFVGAEGFLSLLKSTI
jgi:hypothetical protein